MSKIAEQAGVVHPYARPDLPFAIPVQVLDLIDLPFTIIPPVLIAQHRAQMRADEMRRQAMDWRAFVPADAEERRPAAVTPEEPRIYGDDGFLDEEAMRMARIDRLRGEDEWQTRAIRARATSGKVWPTAAEYAVWSDERLNRAYDREHLDEVFWPEDGWPDEDPDRDPAGAEEPEVHPLHGVMRDLETYQSRLREAESERVAAALRAWRSAEEFVLGTTGAMVNGPFHRSVMMQLAEILQVAEPTASALVHAADDIDRHLARCWDRFLAAEVPWRAMQILHAQFDGLDEEHWADFDEQASAKLVDTPVPQLKRALHDLRERIQARTAADRHKEALKRMSVGIEPAADGMAYLTALLPAAEAVFIDQRLDLAARAAWKAEGEDRPIGALRAHIFMDVLDEGLFRGVRSEDTEGLAVPERRGVQCKVGLLIPAMTAMGHSDVPAVLEGYGPIDIETAKRLAGAATSWIKVLTDPITGAVIDIGRDKYRPTSDMRTLLGLLDRGGRGPNCTRPPSQTEMDHVVPFNQHLARGETALRNLVLLAVAHHRAKTSGLWHIQLQALRVLVWTSFMGTRIITRTAPLPPTPVPEEFLTPPKPSATPPPVATEWAEDGATDELDCPF